MDGMVQLKGVSLHWGDRTGGRAAEDNTVSLPLRTNVRPLQEDEDMEKSCWMVLLEGPSKWCPYTDESELKFQQFNCLMCYAITYIYLGELIVSKYVAESMNN